MTPCSDNDFAFLFEESLEENAFLSYLQGQILHRGEFTRDYGFVCEALPFSLDDVPDLDGKQLNAFLDMRAVYDPTGFTEVFRDRIRNVYDPFDHFLHIRKHWGSVWEPASWKCERLDRFDIKNEGLRVFLAGVWTLAGEQFCPSWEIYESDACSDNDLKAYDFLLRVRGIVQLRHPGMRQSGPLGDHPEDVLSFDDFTSFGNLLPDGASEFERYEFANAVRAELLSSRRRVGRFARGVIQTALKKGRPVRRGSRIVLGLGGLYDRPPRGQVAVSDEEKSRIALSLLLASQRYGIDIDPAEVHTTFLNTGEWLVLVPQLGELFYEERGSLADAFAFLAGTDGAEERLFPGYAQFEASLDGRVMDEQQSLRGALERQKVRILEDYVCEGNRMLTQAISEARLKDVTKNLCVEVEAASLDGDDLAAVKLALKTKRLPVTDDDLETRADQSRPLHERFSSGISGIPLDEYFVAHQERGGFSAETISLACFLIRNRRAFRDLARVGYNSEKQVEQFVKLCQSEAWLRALYVFTQVDQAEWNPPNVHSVHRAGGFNIRELYIKAMATYHPPPDVKEQLVHAGFTPDHLDVLEDFKGVFNGAYARLSHRFCSHLIELAENADKGPLVRLIFDGPSTIIGVAARDYRGLAATVTGGLAEKGIPLLQAHLFSAKRYGLVLDFFHVVLPDRTVGTEVASKLDAVLRDQEVIGHHPQAVLPPLWGKASLVPWDDSGRFQLQVETQDQAVGLMHALTSRIYGCLEAGYLGVDGLFRGRHGLCDRLSHFARSPSSRSGD